jgi:hypothetical protein
VTTIPEMCMQYTQVFTTFKLETAIAIGIGFAIGALAKWLGDR